MAHRYKKLVKGNKEIVLPESKFNFLMFLWFIPVALVWLGGFSIVMFFILIPIACLSILVIKRK